MHVNLPLGQKTDRQTNRQTNKVYIDKKNCLFLTTPGVGIVGLSFVLLNSIMENNKPWERKTVRKILYFLFAPNMFLPEFWTFLY